MVLVVGLVGCSQSELDRLKSERSRLDAQVVVVDKKASELREKCEQALIEFNEARQSKKLDQEKIRNKGIEICEDAGMELKKSIEIRNELLKLEVAIMSKEGKEN